ncbi:MAG TPA: TonB family protein [Candidatus Eisenbacteria bacterium]|nr:TonB family protein [Candidatus Eisenbacteria bacterium]
MTPTPGGQVTLYQFMPYGAPELMEVAKQYMFRATLGGIAIVVALMLGFLGYDLFLARQARSLSVVTMQVSDLAPPPPLSQAMPPPQVRIQTPVAPPAAAIPVPVPDKQAPQAQTIPTQDEQQLTPGVSDQGPDRVIRVAPPGDEELPDPSKYVYVEELPEAITRVQPTYPDLARDAGVDGTVVVQALVDRTGHVRDVKVVKSVPMLDAAAEAAVRQWVFKPALSSNKPVAVWVAVPIHFSLTGH